MQQKHRRCSGAVCYGRSCKRQYGSAGTILSCICKINSLYAGVPAKKVRIVFGLSLNKKTCLFDTGVLELAIAFYPIIAGYGYGSFKLSFGFLLILDLCLFGRISLRNGQSFNKIYHYLAFIVLHNFLWLFLMPSIPSYFVNSFIADVIYLVSIIIIVPHLDFEKLKNAIYIVSIVCIIGLFYHVILIMSGQSIQPIKLPFMPDMSSQTRLYSFLDRPTSFFWEPQSYASFMLVPLFFTLYEKKIIYAFGIALSMILSTSTTGIFMALFMIGFFMITQKQKMRYRVLGLVAVAGLLYILLYSSFAEAGLEKLQNTDVEENNRTINGWLIAANMNVMDWIFGVPYANLQDAYEAGYITKELIIYADGEVFVSAFWLCLCCQGLIGLFFFLNIYWDILKKDRTVLPYLVCIIIGLFSNPDILGAAYVFQLMIMYTFITNKKVVTCN